MLPAENKLCNIEITCCESHRQTNIFGTDRQAVQVTRVLVGLIIVKLIIVVVTAFIRRRSSSMECHSKEY